MKLFESMLANVKNIREKIEKNDQQKKTKSEKSDKNNELVENINTQLTDICQNIRYIQPERSATLQSILSPHYLIIRTNLRKVLPILQHVFPS